jgi:hypothetical protein
LQEIRIEIDSETIDGQNPGLVARITNSPLPELNEDRNKININIDRKNLLKLRNKPIDPDMDISFLRKLGTEIREFLGSTILTQIKVSRIEIVRNNLEDKKLRIAIYIKPNAIKSLDQNFIRTDEIPFELLWDDQDEFYALNINTPIVRVVLAKSDRKSETINVPLKVLVIVSTPKDKPESSIDIEKQIIQKALKSKLADEKSGMGGMIWLKWCIPATKTNFSNMLKDFNPHIIHFIGHGGFDDVVGTTAQGYLCFEREDDNNTDPMTADDLSVFIRNSAVRLFITTACSSAKPAADEIQSTQYNTFAFEGVAQKLVSGISGITTAVAMQFDMEEDAAVAFTEEFYNELIQGKTIEEVVTLARIAVVAKKTTKHPAWISPVLFSRSEDGKLFNMRLLVSALTPEEQKEVDTLEAEIQILRQSLEDVMPTLTSLEPQPKKEIIDRFDNMIKTKESKRSMILGDSIRVPGERTKKNTDIELPINLRVRNHKKIDRIEFEMQYPINYLQNVDINKGKDVTILPTRTAIINDQQTSTSTFKVLILCSAGSTLEFDDGEYEIAKFISKTSSTIPTGFTEVLIKNVQIYLNNNLIGNQGMAAALFIED